MNTKYLDIIYAMETRQYSWRLTIMQVIAWFGPLFRIFNIFYMNILKKILIKYLKDFMIFFLKKNKTLNMILHALLYIFGIL